MSTEDRSCRIMLSVVRAMLAVARNTALSLSPSTLATSLGRDAAIDSPLGRPSRGRFTRYGSVRPTDPPAAAHRSRAKRPQRRRAQRAQSRLRWAQPLLPAWLLACRYCQSARGRGCRCRLPQSPGA